MRRYEHVSVGDAGVSWAVLEGQHLLQGHGSLNGSDATSLDQSGLNFFSPALPLNSEKLPNKYLCTSETFTECNTLQQKSKPGSQR